MRNAHTHWTPGILTWRFWVQSRRPAEGSRGGRSDRRRRPTPPTPDREPEKQPAELHTEFLEHVHARVRRHRRLLKLVAERTGARALAGNHARVDPVEPADLTPMLELWL
jgi:hypothetical protein